LAFLTRLSSLFSLRQSAFVALARALVGRVSPSARRLPGAIHGAWLRFSSSFPPQSYLAAIVLMEWAEVALARHKDPDDDVVKQVLGYFVRNPKTADTLEGIARWRLLEERVQKSLLQTEAAIDWLVGQRYLEEVTVAGSKETIFRLNPKRLSDAVRLLAKSKADRVRKTG
jgi:hypothetical protein